MICKRQACLRLQGASLNVRSKIKNCSTVYLLATCSALPHLSTHKSRMESLIHCFSQALQQTSGVQRRQYERWRKTLLSCLAHVEAVIDFGDDNDIESGVAQEVLPVVEALRLELDGHLQDGQSTALHYIASSHRSMGCINSETAPFATFIPKS